MPEFQAEAYINKYRDQLRHPSSFFPPHIISMPLGEVPLLCNTVHSSDSFNIIPSSFLSLYRHIASLFSVSIQGNWYALTSSMVYFSTEQNPMHICTGLSSLVDILECFIVLALDHCGSQYAVFCFFDYM